MVYAEARNMDSTVMTETRGEGASPIRACLTLYMFVNGFDEKYSDVSAHELRGF